MCPFTETKKRKRTNKRVVAGESWAGIHIVCSKTNLKSGMRMSTFDPRRLRMFAVSVAKRGWGLITSSGTPIDSETPPFPFSWLLVFPCSVCVVVATGKGGLVKFPTPIIGNETALHTNNSRCKDKTKTEQDEKKETKDARGS